MPIFASSCSAFFSRLGLIFCAFLASVFLAGCGGFVNVSLPNFRPQITKATQEAAQLDSAAQVLKEEAKKAKIKVLLGPVMIERNNNYSNDFEGSVLNVRIESELELLQENIKEQLAEVLRFKGYELASQDEAGEGAGEWEVETVLSSIITETEAARESSWWSGDRISSNLGLSFHAKITLKGPGQSKKISSDTKMDNLIPVSYPVAGLGFSLFSPALSSVPTQLNAGLEGPAFELDRAFLDFYKNTINAFYANLPSAAELAGQGGAAQEKVEVEGAEEGGEFNEFIPSEDFDKQNPATNQKDGVELFE